MKTSSKKISIVIAFAAVAAVIIVSLCTSMIVWSNTTSSVTAEELNRKMQTAENAVSIYETSYARNNFVFTDELFSKANIVAAALTENSTDEEVEALSRYLSAESVMVTDSDGECVVAYPNDLKGTSMFDDENIKSFGKVLKGISFKSQTEPQPVDESNEEYSLYTCVGRPDGKGVVILKTIVTDYDELLGSDIASECGDNTIIAKENVIVSSSFVGSTAKSLDEIGVAEENLNGASFEISLDGKEYICKAGIKNYFTIVCFAEASNFSQFTTVIISTLIADVILLVLIAVVFIILSKKNK